MIKLHPNILTKDGVKEFAVLPYDEFVRIQEELADYNDLQELRTAKENDKDKPSISLSDVKKMFIY